MSSPFGRVPVAGLLVLTLARCSGEAEANRAKFVVERGPLLFEASFLGELVARKKVEIHTPESKFMWDTFTIESVKDDGSEVKEGEVVMQFERGTVENEKREKEAELALARAEMDRTRHRLDAEEINLKLQVQRTEMVVARAELNVIEGVNYISKLDLEKSKLDLRRAKLDLDLARKAVTAFRARKKATLKVDKLKVDKLEKEIADLTTRLENMEVKAPADGVLYAPYARLNWNWAKASPGVATRPGEKVLELPDFGAYDIEFYVRQGEIRNIKIDDEITVRPALMPDTIIQGKVSKKDDFASTRNERTGSRAPAGNLKEYKVVAELKEAPDVLRPGGTARVDVKVTLAKKALLVPLAALVREGESYSVMLNGGGKRSVKIGETSTLLAEVLEGLKEGDEVLAAPRRP
jgi:multidrug resistance efflux pump